jgi:acyl-CoA reductase-like NAD-dependent aldehyde dehydrogenase
MGKSVLPFFLGGEWRRSSSPQAAIEVRNPYDNALVGIVAQATEPDINTAVERALVGFEKTRRLQSHERHEILTFIAAKISERKDEFAELLCKEVGKPISAARTEVGRSVLTYQLAAEEARRIGGEVVPLDLNVPGQNRYGIVRRFPIGIVLAIAPFNFPLNLVAHKVAPAIACGNAVILKPTSSAPIISLKLAEIVEASGYPSEAFSVLPCSSHVAETLVKDQRIKMLSFTGSPAVGWPLKALAGKKKVLLELGGNAGVIVDRSANLEEAVRKNLLGAFVYSGQVCIKVQRIYVHADVFDEYTARFVDGSKQLLTGDPRDPATIVGPVITPESASRILACINEAREEGAKVLTGGGHVGSVIEPTVLVNVTRTSKAFCTEIFGPVVTLHKFSTIEEAVACVNDSTFGLQAGIFSNDHRNILYAYNNLEVGALIVNENPTFRVDNMPYGGVKDSGFGREGIRYAIEEMTEPKMLAMGM